MLFTSRVGRIVSFIIFILGTIGILFIPFLNIIFKIILIIIYFLIIQIVGFLNFKKSFIRYANLSMNCNFIELEKEVEKKYNENRKSITKPLYELCLRSCYSYLHEFNKAKPFVDRIETKYSKTKDSVKKIKYNYYLFSYYFGIKDHDKIIKLRDDMKRLLQTVNIDYNRNDKQDYLSNYYGMNYRISLCEEKTDKKILQEAEEYFLKGFNDEILSNKVTNAINLITIYEKLGNEKKAREYADFVIKNHKDYYIDEEIFAKYSKQ